MMHYFIYDERCGLCVAFKEWLMDNAQAETFEAISFDDPRIPQILRGKAETEIRESAHVVTPNGRVLSGHSAILVTLSVRWWGRLIRPVLSLPFLDPFLRFIYTWISKNRYRLSCRLRDSKQGGPERPLPAKDLK